MFFFRTLYLLCVMNTLRQLQPSQVENLGSVNPVCSYTGLDWLSKCKDRLKKPEKRVIRDVEDVGEAVEDAAEKIQETTRKLHITSCECQV